MVGGWDVKNCRLALGGGSTVIVWVLMYIRISELWGDRLHVNTTAYQKIITTVTLSARSTMEMISSLLAGRSPKLKGRHLPTSFLLNQFYVNSVLS